MMKLKGIGASSGVSFAKAYVLIHEEAKVTNIKITDIEAEIKKFEISLKDSKIQIENIKKIAAANLNEEEASVFDAHIMILMDPMVVDDIKSMINNGDNALFASETVFEKNAVMFDLMEDSYFKERAADVRDVKQKLLNNIAGITPKDLSAINEEVIIVAEDLSPSDTAVLNKKFVKGFLTNIGGRTSHAAIMARSLEIPAVLGLKNITSIAKNAVMLAMDGEEGDVIIEPNQNDINELKARAKELLKSQIEEKTFIGKKSISKDNHEVILAANIGSPKDVEGVIKNDGEAVGLFRSEFLYMNAKDWPTEQEQFESYKIAVEGMNGKEVVVRTLDIGGDKTLDYYKFPQEINPFLGYRAIRMTLDKKDIFQTQLRALIRASEFGNIAIMFPMIATINEFKEAKEEFNKAYKSIKEIYPNIKENIKVGMMVEIPAAAVLSRQFAKHADFFSIGTNDLMQYTMAADRMNEKVSYLYQPLNPAILNMINLTIKGAHAEGIHVGMCGEMAGDKNAIPLLLGMGLDEFSMSSSSILGARKLISKINKKEAEKIVVKVLSLDTEEEVHF
ncbi:MAG: phosphoenolpyruvate--protein phosphotransferase, partial [Mollicutes bacterium PWAP]|nr:phosphoenolpyruvate--protein phosphotransferase [Mollicutes bacterium PWAP]